MRAFLTIFRRFPKILQNLSEDHTNVAEHFSNRLPKTFEEDRKMFRSHTNEFKRELIRKKRSDWSKTYVLSEYKYLLLTEFEVRTVSCGPSFFLFGLWPKRKRAGYKSKGENEDP